VYVRIGYFGFKIENYQSKQLYILKLKIKVIKRLICYFLIIIIINTLFSEGNS